MLLMQLMVLSCLFQQIHNITSVGMGRITNFKYKVCQVDYVHLEANLGYI